MMGKQATGKRQHFVPQQMIRNFADPADGMLVELLKPDLEIRTKRRSPRSILFGYDFYRDCVSDLDGELLTPIDQRFRLAYPQVLAHAELNGDEGTALIDWIAAMLIRTQLISNVMPLVPEAFAKPVAIRPGETKKLFDNLARTEWFSMYQDLFTRKDWEWKFRRFTSACLVLSDHPVCITSIYQQGGQIVVVPMASDVVLIGGTRDAIEAMQDATPFDINFFLAAYANRSIFACDSAVLDTVRRSLSDESPFPFELVKAARQPFFGLPERICERMKSASVQKNFDFDAEFRRHVESFGPHVWEAGI